jgi:hypothetical protein
MALNLAALNGTLMKVAEFHHDHINKHKCESWEQYKKDIESYINSSRNNWRLIEYLNKCTHLKPLRVSDDLESTEKSQLVTGQVQAKSD